MIVLPLLQFYTLGPLERHAGSQSVEAGHAGANQWPWIISSLYSPASFLFSCALCSLGPCRLCLAATHHMIPVRSQSLSCRSFLLFPHSLGTGGWPSSPGCYRNIPVSPCFSLSPPSFSLSSFDLLPWLMMSSCVSLILRRARDLASPSPLSA